MQDHNQPLEMHVHGDIPIRHDVTSLELSTALLPLKNYTQRHFAAQGVASLYPEEKGVKFDETEHVLHFCWSVAGDIDFRETLDELVMGLNDLASEGAMLEVSIYDLEADDEEWSHERSEHADMDDDSSSAQEAEEARDDFFVLFVGPTPGDIMQVQRDLLVRDVTLLMERHFAKEEMTPVVQAIDSMWEERFQALVNSLQMPGTKKATGSTQVNHSLAAAYGFGQRGGTTGGRKSRHSH